MDSLPISGMESLAYTLAAMLRAGDIITLAGEVGSGKTSFARAVIRALSSSNTEVTSPTFTLMQSYPITLASGQTELLWHLDLYRLNHIQEAFELGLEELWPHITLIEWAEVIEPMLPVANRLDIAFDFGSSHDSRTLVIRGDSGWHKRF